MKRSLVALTGLLVSLGVALPATPAAADEIYSVPPGGSFAMEGHGWGHGHGMSQYGAQGGAKLGKTSEQITSFYYPGTTRTTLPNSAIRVLISGDKGGDTQVYPATGLTVADLATGAKATLPAGPTRWRTTTDTAGLHLQSYSAGWHPYTLGGTTTFAGPIEFGGTSYVRLALPDGSSRDYRGSMRSVRTSATTVASINVLSMESYLAGVVPRESSSSWAAAALQSQAIAARTYSAENRSRYATTRSYDICDTTQCQVYGGAALYSASGTKTNLEASSTSAAVTATAGVIRTYDGRPIFAQYSASNGGWSTDGGYPYLIAQRDDWDGVVPSTVHTWTATLTAAQLQAKFPAVGTLRRIRVTSRDGNGEWGGRVKTVVLEGVDGQGAPTAVSTTGAGVYSAHTWPAFSDGLRSSWWHVNAAAGSAIVSQSTAPTLVQSPGLSTGTLTVTMRNTGTVGWTTSGLHLAVSSPAGEADPLVGNSRSPGRYTGTATDIAPGETAAFSFALTGDNVPIGLHGRSYRLAIAGGPLFGATVSWKIPVVAPVFLGQSTGPPTNLGTLPAGDNPGSLLPDGRTVVVPVTGSTPLRLTVKNTGNLAWPAASSVVLGTSTPRSHPTDASPSSGSSWLRTARPSALAATTAPGATGSFDLTLYGNSRPLGLSREAFEPLWEGKHWIDGALTSLYVIRVDPSVSRRSTLENAPTSLALDNGPHATTSVRVRLRNVGGDPWTVGQEQLTSTATPLSTSAWTSSTTPPALGSNASRPGQAKVYPGEVGEWQVPLSALNKAAGTYSLALQATGGPRMALTVKVASAVLKGQLTKVGPSVSVPRNGTATTYFEVKNLGNVSWALGGDLHSFALTSGGSPSYASSWLSTTRPGGLGANVTRPGARSVAPGEVGRFSIVLAGNNRPPQTVSEPFGLIWEAWARMSLTARLPYKVV